VSGVSGQISSSSRQGDREGARVAVGEPGVSAAAEAETHSSSLSRAREMALLRCLRAREAARVGGGDTNKGEIEDIVMIQAGIWGESRDGCGAGRGACWDNAIALINIFHGDTGNQKTNHRFEIVASFCPDARCFKFIQC
jgi:hypothetical protein